MDGRLREHFSNVAAKRLAAVEVAAVKVSNQHEFNAERSVVEMLGDERAELACEYFYFGDEGEDFVRDEDSTLTYYDSRRAVDHRPAEYRMYYPASSTAMKNAWEGDWLWIARRHDGRLAVIIARDGSESAARLDRLFATGLRERGMPAKGEDNLFGIFDVDSAQDGDLDIADADLLQALGITPSVDNERHLAAMIKKFGGSYPLPTTKRFTTFARSVCAGVDPVGDPDATLFEWFSTTNDLFFIYERHVLQPLLDDVFANRAHIDVDKFFELATKYKNGRFSRAGLSFEHHVEALLKANGVRYGRPKTMKDGSKPDYLMPTLDAYGDADMPDELLTFLAAKTTTKERWRQIVTEATRIGVRHLITMDPGLVPDTLSAMAENNVIPVLPQPVIDMYPGSMRASMMNVADFIALVREREAEAVRLGHIPSAI
ncbi:type II restriction endonuclease [Nocardioides pinisoli]|uniref:Type II restriction endonuclease n=1 Tax=Nocardioides pinisoli TaxID=2950279 RepID=A0ABT1KTH7_9ACTN|nr:type II restriction endonuclease [Nocardioides pinisoli]MCP3420353.1 type II restriction endonuclease [Nocardioides pinisoli]